MIRDSGEKIFYQSSIGLARKYRPVAFSEIVGQNVMVKILRSALNTGQFPQAILLTGIRGVGKTTTARLIAKALNCSSRDGEHRNIVGENILDGCGKCDQCLSIAASQNQDVLEMDAASNTGVNDIREIIDNCQYRPIVGRYRIYIVDEVHMLSNSAFNALLKVLEDPPPHVKFIFATTEVRKIPLTVLSRCQRFYLQRVSGKELQKYYVNVLEKEGYSIDERALNAIVKASDGSVRDGLSILEQAILMSNEKCKIIYEDLASMLGLGDMSALCCIFKHIVLGEATEALDVVSRIYHEGKYEFDILLSELLSLIHIISRAKVCDNVIMDSNLEISIDEQYHELFMSLELPFLMRAWQIVSESVEQISTSDQKLALTEITVIKLMCVNAYETPENLIVTMKKVAKNENTEHNVGKKIVNNDLYDDISASEKSEENKKEKFYLTPFISEMRCISNMIREAQDLELYNWFYNKIVVKFLNLEKRWIKYVIDKDSHDDELIARKLNCLGLGDWTIERELSGFGELDNLYTLAMIDKIEKKQKEVEILNHPLVKAVTSEFDWLMVEKIHISSINDERGDKDH